MIAADNVRVTRSLVQGGHVEGSPSTYNLRGVVLEDVTVVGADGKTRNGRVLQVMGYLGLERQDVELAEAGDIVCVTGIDALQISDTLCDPATPEALPPLTVDEPTVSMTFQVNDSPFAALEGKYVTSRNIKDRLDRELIHNVALRVEQGDTPAFALLTGAVALVVALVVAARLDRRDRITPTDPPGPTGHMGPTDPIEHADRSRRTAVLAATAAGLAVVAVLTMLAAQHGERSVVPLEHVFSVRVLPYPGRVDWFADHADNLDLHAIVGPDVDVQPLADWVLARQILPHERLADDGDVRRIIGVAIREVASGE